METKRLAGCKPFACLSAAVLALFASVAFSTDISISNFSDHANITLADNTLLWSALFLLLFFAYVHVLGKKRKAGDCLTIGILSLLFGFGNVIGHSLHYLGNWDFLFGNTYQLLLGSVCAVGYAGVFFVSGLFLFGFLDSQADCKAVSKPGCLICRLLDDRPMLFCSIVIGAVLLCWLIIYFPGYTNNDLNYQLQQFYGKEALTNSHPVLSTVIIGSCMSLGKALGSDNLGLFFYMLLQAAVFVYAFGSVCRLAKKTGIGYAVRILILVFYAVLPVWGAYSVQAMKDGLFAGIFTLFVTRSAEAFLLSFGEEKLSVGFVIRLTVVSVLTSLLRSAAAFIVVPSLLLLVFACLRNRSALRVLLSAVVTGVFAFGFIYGLLPKLGVIKCNKAESLSIPFQQVARIVKEHGDELTDEERLSIDAVLDYNALPEVYMPVLSDAVKDTYKQREQPTEEQALSAFKATWVNLVKRYPQTALQATLSNTYGYFSFTPSIQTSNGHTGMCFFLSDEKNNGTITTDTYSITYPTALKPIRKLVLTVSYLVDAVPGINMLYACAFYFWMVMLVNLYILRRGGLKLIGLCSACVFLQLGCLGSSVNDCFRYEAPIAAALPVLIILACAVSKIQSGSRRI